MPGAELEADPAVGADRLEAERACSPALASLGSVMPAIATR